MQLIDNGTQGGTSVPTPQAASGTPGYANSGTPGSFAATVLDPDVFNRIVAEIMAVLAAASITPDRTNNAQLLAGIKAVSAGQIKSQLVVASTVVTTASATFSFTPSSSGHLLIIAQGGSAGTTVPLSIASSGVTLSAVQCNFASNGALACYTANATLTASTAYTVTVTQTAGAGVTSNNLAAQFIFLPN